MTFSREPLVAPASPTLTFGSKAIPSAIYSEGNGAAVVTVNATIPVIASFSRDGRTVTISPTASSAAATTTPPASQPATPAASASSTPATPAASAQPTPASPSASPPAASPLLCRGRRQPWRRRSRRDSQQHAHGKRCHRRISPQPAPGTREPRHSHPGAARLRRQPFPRPARRLRQRRSRRHLHRRARRFQRTRRSRLHCAASLRRRRPWTLPAPGPPPSTLRCSLSQTAANAVAAEMQRRQIPVRVLAAPLRPLNNITGAAIAVEVAPQGSDPSQLTAPDYQQLVTSAVATAIASTHDQLGATQ